MTTLKNTPLKTFKKALLVVACSTLGAISVSAQADNVNVPDTIHWTIPFGVGGGTDVWARFFTTWMSDHIQGNPTLVIDNVPGGGSINGSNLFAIRADSDGSQWIGTSASTQYPAMLQDRRVRYDYDDWTPILATPTGGVVYAQPNLGDTAEDVLRAVTEQRVKFAVQSHTGLELPVLIALDLLGVDVQAVSGMRSRGEGRLAFERGEADIDFQTTSAYFSSVAPLVESGRAVPLFSLGVLDDSGQVVRDPAFPDLPTFNEVYENLHGEAPSGPAAEAYRKFFASGFTLQKLILLPKDAPEALIQEYRDAARRFVDTETFKEAAMAQLGPYTPVVGEVVEQHLQDAMSLDDDTRQWLVEWLLEQHGARI
ncbi:Bug family tripartite tricarboxylate transporter substrate binding protein [Vreelandella piezotolerans]|jgi:tripartite-type tricarboxylate transporter receptor subunit TctC|uniref:Bug family tripartite tricarboxylate transporter substrate binding protein n=1 Tax=Vreelandella piezotolerans TaxID=2609667 RepID=UPI001E3DD016|nr:tricarboxylate transporter [Halomonas piezotolerans]